MYLVFPVLCSLLDLPRNRKFCGDFFSCVATFVCVIFSFYKISLWRPEVPRPLITFQNLLCLTPLIWQNFCACIIEDNKNGIRRFKWLKNRIMNLRMPFLGYVFENRVNPGRFLTLLLCMHKNSVNKRSQTQ